MNEEGTDKAQAAKPSRLAGLVRPKGEAPRPSEPVTAPQAAAQSPSQPTRQPPAPIPAPIGTGSKSLTLRLPDAEYERLRARAFATRMTHQGILAEALRRFLDEE